MAVLALAAGFILSSFVVSPAEIAGSAAAPVAGFVTAPVEKRVLENTVTARADVSYADPVDIEVDASGLGGPAVVTGHVPSVGSTLDAGAVALEVAGRPLLVLPGELPAYRSLRVGLSGPDVLQLKAALVALGIDPGDAASDSYDLATAAAVEALYRRAGYPAPTAGQEATAQRDAARAAVAAASADVERSRAALSTAEAGPSAADRLEGENAVRQAQRDLDAAIGGGAAPAEIDRLQDALRLASARLAQGVAPPDTSAERGALEFARQALADANARVESAERDAATPLPIAEIVFLTALPRRVDSVAAKRGSVLEKAAMSVSGAEIVLAGTVSEADAALVPLGGAASFVAGDGRTLPATVRSVTRREASGPSASAPTGSGGASGSAGSDSGAGSGSAPGTGSSSGDPAGRFDVVLVPDGVDATTLESLKGSNVRLSIPVQSTGGEVFAVPVAAITAGPGGESRIQLLVDGGAGDGGAGDGGAGDGGEPVVVEVVPGLSAGGFVEIRDPDPRIVPGARVVVGR